MQQSAQLAHAEQNSASRHGTPSQEWLPRGGRSMQRSALASQCLLALPFIMGKACARLEAHLNAAECTTGSRRAKQCQPSWDP